MTMNAKDISAGLLLIAVAVAGLWVNRNYDLGLARNMGPGYMPMLVCSLLFIMGVVVLATGFFNGPDPLERWAWRELFFVLAAMAAFAMLLNKGGLLLAVGSSVGIAAMADKTHRPLGVAALILFLVALCWFVFIRQLGIRVNVWPAF